jgi:hypothetical protein
MSNKIRILTGELELIATLNQSETAQAIWQALPLEGTANRWGEEIYFTIPLELPEAPDARQDMQVGELAYWPAGSAFCIFFGPTPVSEGAVPRAYSNVNPLGQIEEGAQALSEVKDGHTVRVESAS